MALSPRFEKLVAAGKMDPMKAQARSARGEAGKLPFQRQQARTTSTVPPAPQGDITWWGGAPTQPRPPAARPPGGMGFQTGGGLQGGPANPQGMVERLPAAPPQQTGGAADFLSGGGLQQLLARLRGNAANAQASGYPSAPPPALGDIQQMPGEIGPGGGMTKPLDMGPAGVDSNAFAGQGQDTQGNSMIPGLGSAMGGQGARLGAILARLRGGGGGGMGMPPQPAAVGAMGRYRA